MLSWANAICASVEVEQLDGCLRLMHFQHVVQMLIGGTLRSLNLWSKRHSKITLISYPLSLEILAVCFLNTLFLKKCFEIISRSLSSLTPWVCIFVRFMIGLLLIDKSIKKEYPTTLLTDLMMYLNFLFPFFGIQVFVLTFHHLLV